MGKIWIFEGHYLQAITVLLVIALMVTVFAWLIRTIQRRLSEDEGEKEAETEPKPYNKDIIGLD